MKKSILSSIIGVFITIFVGGWASSGYKDFYKPYYKESDNDFRNKYKELEFLKEGEEPLVYSTDNFDRDILSLQSKRFFPIGQSNFNGGFEDETAVKEQAKRIGAKIALYGWKYTNTQTNSGVLMLPKTNYSTTNLYGSVGGTMYSGTAYTQSSGTQMVPYSNTQRRYDQTAVFFIKSNYPYDFGTASSTEISRDERIKIGSFGIKVNVIIENTPAFNSDLLIGDVIIGVNNEKINNYADYDRLTNNCVSNKGECLLEVYRNDSVKNIIINF